MNPVQVFDCLLSGVNSARGSLPASVEKSLIEISPSEMSRVRAKIEAIPDMLRALHEAEYHLRLELMGMITVYGKDNTSLTSAVIKELETLVNRIYSICEYLM